MDQELVKKWFATTADLVVEHIDEPNGRVRLYYLGTMADEKLVYGELIPKLRRHDLCTIKIEQLESGIGSSASRRLSRQQDVIDELLKGGIYIHVRGEPYGILIPSDGTSGRAITSPEIEANVLGPQLAFVESLEVNTSIIRKYLRTPRLMHERKTVGDTMPTEVAIMYLDGIADEENVNTLRQRINDLAVDGVLDSNMLAQYLADNEISVFPQLQSTQRPDRVVSSLRQGHIAVIVQGSPFVLLGPTTLIQFFQSPDDFYFRWGLATFVRMMRMLAMVLSLLLAPAYVASLTFHYELIPADLLLSLAQSRSRVPFPPLFEALLMEGIIELLREAGARLPTKVGQTIGIVGGIVIGQATVQAGFTSNILIIIVALGALSSFIAPSYVLGYAIRVIRFPMILLAGTLGGIGIAVAFSFLLSHLFKQTSLGRPYLHPVYPLRISDLKDSFIRMPLALISKRPYLLRPNQENRFPLQQGMKKQDIDE